MSGVMQDLFACICIVEIRAILRCHSKMRPIRVKRHRLNADVWQSSKSDQCPACCGIIDAKLIISCVSHTPSIGAKDYSQSSILVWLKGHDFIATCSIDDARRVQIIIGKQFAIRAVCDVAYDCKPHTVLACELNQADLLARDRVPDSDGAIPADGCQLSPIGIVCHVLYAIGVTDDIERVASGGWRDVPYLDRAIPAGGI